MGSRVSAESHPHRSTLTGPPSPVHPHEGAPMLFYYNFFIFEAKSLICSLVGAFLWLSRGVASLWCQVCFRSSVVVNLHFWCPNSASVLSSCYSWYQFTWKCLQLEFSENHWFKADRLNWGKYEMLKIWRIWKIEIWSEELVHGYQTVPYQPGTLFGGGLLSGSVSNLF